LSCQRAATSGDGGIVLDRVRTEVSPVKFQVGAADEGQCRVTFSTMVQSRNSVSGRRMVEVLENDTATS
jgi:hypothetical protein